MHVHAFESGYVRTTIELSDEQRARLLEIGARRGLKGFSSLVREAIDRYLEDEPARDAQIRGALDALGTLDDDAADELEASVRQARSRWR
jgi:predicted DNA-binding protein